MNRFAGQALAAALLTLLDQGVKWLAFAHLQPEQTVPLLDGFAALTLRRNYGFTYSVGEGLPGIRLLTIAMSLVGLAILIWAYRKRMAGRYSPFWSGAMMVFLLAGLTGNFTDRLFLGYVRDFLLVRPFGVVNLADLYGSLALLSLGLALTRPARPLRSPSSTSKPHTP